MGSKQQQMEYLQLWRRIILPMTDPAFHHVTFNKKGMKRLDMEAGIANFPTGNGIWAEECNLFPKGDMQPGW